MRVSSRGVGVGVVLVCTALGLGGTSAVAATDATAAPVVTFAVKDGSAKVSGAKGLKAGWVTIKATSKDGPHSLWFYKYTGATKAKAPAGSRLRAIRPADPDAAAGPPTKGERTRSISTAGGLERDYLALGGLYVDPKHPVTMRVKLPAGRISVLDRFSTQMGDLTSLQIGSAGTAKGPGKPTATVTANDRNALTVPSTLARTGVLQFSNVSKQAGSWHDLALRRLKKGKTAADVKRYFTTYKNSPFVEAKGGSEDASASAPLSAGRSHQVTYSLAPGTYALYDGWLDERGNANAAKGAVKIVKVK
jgi:hypothetical protein